MLSRRNMIQGLGAGLMMVASPALAGTTIRPGTRLDSLVPRIDPVLDMENAHTGEQVSLRYFRPAGYDLAAIRQINWFMRDHRQAEAVVMDARLFWALSAIRMAARQDGHSGRIILLSGYRSARTNQMLRERGVGAARNSLHIEGKAADITLPGIPVSQVSRYAEWLQVGGVGSYRRSNFTHIDSGRERGWTG